MTVSKTFQFRAHEYILPFQIHMLSRKDEPYILISDNHGTFLPLHQNIMNEFKASLAAEGVTGAYKVYRAFMNEHFKMYFGYN